ncbi:serine beta-lactamase-like protein LACTB, mitochondrial isoform X2 [Neophocaena asiaeorientalis asiaeorientalis]|uniref:Serine beta-lactamase-like protein LACTB, mitochondrial isoform X2 n=1 Tax=Neophocaena asiaeorientalis asiaeorientalis TaxID=1706337 RepID=A0A341AKA4_NEOAA|nr:serine beta-lactamase-like protein LACTB, mitochondrial isoform X2 [Neophocaena asiaeorientalis asiaeorientalis]XP_032480236.1 serine beta-lactamase-like protein LACTB, mitochondrial isoform X2 [Phocoena sinus]
MYRLLSAVTNRAVTHGSCAWGCGRRAAHQRAGLPPLGPGWVGGLGLGLGLALGVKLAGGLRGASPAPPTAAPDPETPPQAEPLPPQEQPLAQWSPQTPTPPHSRRFARAIDRSRDLLHRIKDEVGAPGIVVGVSVDGKEVWSEGLGYADVENRVPCKPETVMRIASISKSLTMVAIAKLWEAGKLDLDIPVQHYVPEFPEKEYEGEKVSVTTRLLISHLSGIRHYEKDMKKVKEEKAYKALKMMKGTMESDQEKELKVKGGKSNEKNDFAKAKIEQDNEAKGRNSKPCKKKNDFEQGSQFLYSTFGYTLLAAIVERASGYKYLDYMQKIFHDLDMLTTVQEENEPVIYNRARFYVYNKKRRLVNTPYVDNSYKWAGGGFLSTVGDLLKFGNAMLYGYQVGLFKNSNENLLPGYLKPETMLMIWTPVPNTEMSWDKEGKYAMAWGVVEKKQTYGSCRKQRHYASHTGGAVGASSVLLVLPEELDAEAINNKFPPRGTVVSIICNMQSVGLNNTALKIALEFDKDRSDMP